MHTINKKFHTQCGQRSKSAYASNDPIFGATLLKHKIVNESQLRDALKYQKENRKFIGNIIADKGFAKPEAILNAVNSHFKISAVSLSDNIEELISNQSKNFWRKLLRTRIPIKVKLSIAITLLICLAIGALSYIILNRESKQLYNQTVRTGKVSLNYFENNARIPMLSDDTVGLNNLIKQASSIEEFIYAFIVDRNNMLKAHTDFNKVGTSLPKTENAKNTTKEGNVSYFSYYDSNGINILNLSTTIAFQGKELGTIHLGVSLDFINKQITQATYFILVLGVFIIGLGIVISVILGIGFSRPISRLAAATREIGKGNFRHRVKVTQNDEIGDLASAFNFMSEELSQKAIIQQTFGQYVSPDVVKMILSNPDYSWLKGSREEATIIFADVRGFASYSENRQPEEIVEVLNHYFEIATKWIYEYGGHVDKFIGDAVMGVFGAPVHYEDHAVRAVKACLAMQDELWKSENTKSINAKIGIGINSGVVIAGNIGSQVKTDYTVIGDAVNIASRLTGLADPGQVIISENTYRQVKHLVKVGPSMMNTIKGKTNSIRTYLVLDID